LVRQSEPSATFTHDPFFPRVSRIVDGVGTAPYEYADAFPNCALALATEGFAATAPSACIPRIDCDLDALNRLARQTVDGGSAGTFSYHAVNISDLGSFATSYLGATPQVEQAYLAQSTRCSMN
jgi:hypothetical protein